MAGAATEGAAGAGAPAAGAAAASAAELCSLVDQLGAARQHSYLYNINLGGGGALPLRLPSVRGPAAANGAAGDGAQSPLPLPPPPKRRSRAHLEAGTTLRQEATR